MLTRMNFKRFSALLCFLCMLVLAALVGVSVTDTGVQAANGKAAAVTVKLTADGEVIETKELTAAMNWRHTFENLPKYDGKDGHEIIYSVKEETVKGYSSAVSGDMNKGFTITNRKDQLKTTSSATPSDGASPKTGDDSLLPIWLLTMALSGLSLVGLIVACKKRQSHE